MHHNQAQRIGRIRVKKAFLVPLTSFGGLSGTVSGTCTALASGGDGLAEASFETTGDKNATTIRTCVCMRPGPRTVGGPGH